MGFEKKLAVWERFCHFERPHGAHGVEPPNEALREQLSWITTSDSMPNITVERSSAVVRHARFGGVLDYYDKRAA